MTLATNAYAGMPDITEVNPRTEEDQPLFNELAQVLKKHGALDRFGISLLHTHYPMKDGEIIVEKTDVEERLQTLEPDLPENVIGQVIETQWRLDEFGNALTACICVEPRNGEHTHISHGKYRKAD